MRVLVTRIMNMVVRMSALLREARDGRDGDIRPSSFDNFAWGEIHVGRALAEPHKHRRHRQENTQLVNSRCMATFHDAADGPGALTDPHSDPQRNTQA